MRTLKLTKYVCTCMYYNNYMYIYQIVHGTKGHVEVYGPGCHPQNIIWTEAKLRSIYYFVGDRPVHKLQFGPKCHELFVYIILNTCKSVSRHVFCYCIFKTKKRVRTTSGRKHYIDRARSMYVVID
jgi:hypothetical protein